MKFNLRKFCLKAGLFGTILPAMILSAGAAQAAEANYPTRPITLVVGYAPGGTNDIVARIIAKSLTDELKQTVIVDNKPGANSNIAAEYVAHAKDDGYTLYVGGVSNTISRALYPNLKYDFLKSFEYVGLMATIPNVLVVNPKLPIHSVSDYIKYAKEHPGKLTCASSGVGSSVHLTCELFKIQTGTNILHVPYRGSAPAVADLLGGHVDSMFDNLPSPLPHIQSGTLRALAITTSKRSKFLPKIPTFEEEGVKNLLVHSWVGINAPAGTPAPIINKLNAALNEALKSPEVLSAYEKNAISVPEQPNSPASYRKYSQSEIDKWAAVIDKAHVKLN